MIAANTAKTVTLDRGKIPPQLTSINRWVTWRAGQQKATGKFDKVPINPTTGRNVNGIDPDNWLTFEEALAAYDAGKCSGIGLALSDDPVATWGNVLCGAPLYLTALDLDHCGDKLKDVKALQRDLGGIYGEISPSGNGVRMFALSRTPPKGGNAGEGREMYSRGRFVTVTGVGGRGEIIDATEKLNELSCQWFPVTTTKPLLKSVMGGAMIGLAHGVTDQATLALAGNPLETPEAISRVRAQLACIDAGCDYETWRNVVWSVLSTGWKCAEDLVREWSCTSEDKYDEKPLNVLVKDFDPSRGITLGTLDHYAREGGWRPLAAVPRAQQAQQANEEPSKIHRLITAAQLKALPPLNWLIRGLLPTKGLASIYGPSGSGKTFLALDMACAIAAGKNWFNATVKAAPVAYVALEGEGGIRQRIGAWEKHYGQPAADGLRFVLGNYTLLESGDSTLLAEEILSALGTGSVVFIDTLNQAAPGADENTSSDMGRIITNAKTLAAAVGGIVVLVHHSGKDVSRGMRGHSSLFAAMDAVIEVISTATGRTWRVAKSKDSVSGVAHRFELVHHMVGQDEDGLHISSCAIRHVLSHSPAKKPVRGKHQIAALAVLTGLAATHPNGIPAKVAQQAVADGLDCAAGRRASRAIETIKGLTNSGHLTQRDEGVFLT